MLRHSVPHFLPDFGGIACWLILFCYFKVTFSFIYVHDKLSWLSTCKYFKECKSKCWYNIYLKFSYFYFFLIVFPLFFQIGCMFVSYIFPYVGPTIYVHKKYVFLNNLPYSNRWRTRYWVRSVRLSALLLFFCLIFYTRGKHKKAIYIIKLKNMFGWRL